MARIVLCAQTTNLHPNPKYKSALPGSKIVDHSDVVEAWPADAAPAASSFSNLHLPSMDWAKPTARRGDFKFGTSNIIDFFFLYIKLMCPYFILLIYTDGERDGLPFPDTGCPVPDVSIYYMSNINELPDGILFHWFCKCTPPWMFLPLDIPSEYRPEHVTFGLLCVIFKFPSRIFCRRVSGFATDCPCGVWCRGLTTCLLYVGPPLEF